MPKPRKLNVGLIKAVAMFMTAIPIGFASMLSGLGAQVTAAPAIQFLLGLTPDRCVATSTLVTLVCAVAGVLGAASSGIEVSLEPALLLAIGATVGVMLSTGLTKRLANLRNIRMAQSLVILMTIFVIMDTMSRRVGGPSHADWSILQSAGGVLVLGAVAGLLSRVTNVAMGVLVVPALVFLAGLNVSVAFVTAISVVALACILPLVGYAARGQIEPRSGFAMSLGGGAAAYFSGKLLVVMQDTMSPIPLITFAVMSMFLAAYNLSRLNAPPPEPPAEA